MAGTPLTIGLDLGGTKCLGLLVTGDGEVHDEARLPTPRGGEAVLSTLVEASRELMARAGDRGVSAIGVGVPGLVDTGGVLRVAPNLPGVVELPVASALAAATGLPVRVENDATCAGWGERCLGAARGFDDVVLVTLGTGIGGGFILGGALYRGAHGYAGEIGHMVVDPNGPPCVCGQRGCWERFASGSGLGRLAREAAVAGRAEAVVALAGGDPEAVRGEHVTAAAAGGDPGALAVLERFAWWLALGLANLANVLDPQAFVLGGGLVEAGHVLVDPVRAAFGELVEAPDHRPPVAIVPAALGERAGAIGAALLPQNFLPD